MPRPKPPAMESPTVEVMEDEKTVEKKERELRRLDKEIRREFWYLEAWMQRNPGLKFMPWEMESPSFHAYIEFRKERIRTKYAEFRTVLGRTAKDDNGWTIESAIATALKGRLERGKQRAMEGDPK